MIKPIEEVVKDYGAVKSWVARHVFVVPIGCFLIGFLVGLWVG